MRHSSRRARGQQGFRLEVLEDRNLLSHSGASPFPSFLPRPAHPAQAKVAVITGHVHVNPAPSGIYAPAPPGEFSYSGFGSAHPGHFGTVLFGTNQAQTTNAAGTALNITDGTGTFRSVFGEQINVHYIGTVNNSRGGRHTITLTGVIAGGTGRFDYASGSFSANGTVNSLRQFGLKFTLVPKYASP